VVTVHIDTGAEMRGGQWQVLYLLRGLVSLGHEVRLLAPGDSALLHAARAQQLEAIPLRMAALARASSGAALLHAHDARAHTLAALISKPFVVSRRVAFPVRRSFASRWKYRRATHFIAVSQCVKRTLIEAGIDETRISVVYDGVPAPPARESAGRSRVLALDSDDPRKGKQFIEQAAALAGITVTFTRNLSADLADAALFIYISDSEGLGSAVLVAMANRVPVIASNVGGLPEIVKDGVTGLLTPNEPHAIAQRIERLLADQALAAELAQRAAARMECDFTADRMVRETQRVYERIVA